MADLARRTQEGSAFIEDLLGTTDGAGHSRDSSLVAALRQRCYLHFVDEKAEAQVG